MQVPRFPGLGSVVHGHKERQGVAEQDSRMGGTGI